MPTSTAYARHCMKSLPGVDYGEARRFLIAGGINTAIGYGVYALLYAVFGVPYNLALGAEYVVGIIVGFLLNRAFTWRYPQADWRHLVRYVLTYATTYTINCAILNALVLSGLMEPLLGNAVALSVVCVTSFSLQSFWVFRARHAARELAASQSLEAEPEAGAAGAASPSAPYRGQLAERAGDDLADGDLPESGLAKR